MAFISFHSAVKRTPNPHYSTHRKASVRGAVEMLEKQDVPYNKKELFEQSGVTWSTGQLLAVDPQKEFGAPNVNAENSGQEQRNAYVEGTSFYVEDKQNNSPTLGGGWNAHLQLIVLYGTSKKHTSEGKPEARTVAGPKGPQQTYSNPIPTPIPANPRRPTNTTFARITLPDASVKRRNSINAGAKTPQTESASARKPCLSSIPGKGWRVRQQKDDGTYITKNGEEGILGWSDNHGRMQE
ncbi:hypothetical protein MKZ38_003599 [Zalerion maritima]|uniref:Uncharacterized protein n=1 Tax=Zalerion maritima TaxID=339359 RepID=A0AAD5RUA0_9PEZI|nr:hypothetical protein MKZ38_003599 [Zalerion maritima]